MRDRDLLDFEKPVMSLIREIDSLEKSPQGKNCQELITGLREQLSELKENVYSNLKPEQKLQIARFIDRPYTLDYVQKLGQNWIELHGDRLSGDDKAIVGGLLELEPGLTVVLVGTEKGRGIKGKQEHNFGMPQPWGYRKALRLFQHAQNFSLPILTLIDTPGAYPGLEAEAQGQAAAIAKNLEVMSQLTVPIISVVMGEGGSGGALAIGVANKVFMLEHAVYSVISPEGCAAILWRTRDKSIEAANRLKITSSELKELGLIDEIIPEPKEVLSYKGEHFDKFCASFRETIIHNLKELKKLSPQQLKEQREKKFRNYGFFENLHS